MYFEHGSYLVNTNYFRFKSVYSKYLIDILLRLLILLIITVILSLISKWITQYWLDILYIFIKLIRSLSGSNCYIQLL